MIWKILLSTFRYSNISPTLNLVILKLLSQNSAKRFDSPDEIAEIISRMTLNEDETGIQALKKLQDVFKQGGVTSKVPTLSIHMRDTGNLKSRPRNTLSGRSTLQRKCSVYQGPPAWESNLRVVAHTEKVTLIWKTETASAYKCKVVKRGSGGEFLAIREDIAATEHEFEVPGLEPDTGYSATIFNETDFVMRNFTTPSVHC